MATRKTIGPFTRGMNTLSDETSLPSDQCRLSINNDFDRDGHWTRRDGFTRIVAATNVHSLYAPPTSRHVLGCQKNNLGYFDLIDLTFTPLTTMPSAWLTAWVELDGVIYATNPAFSCKLNATTYAISTVAVALPPSLTVQAATAGGLRVGSYTVAYSIVNSAGEESPLSAETKVSVAEGGGIAIIGVPIIPGSMLRVYSSSPDGEELYRVLEAPMIAPSFSVGFAEMNKAGAQPETRFLAELPYGHFIARHGSRLLVASDNMVAFSNAFRPHLWDPRSNFVLMESTITMLASTDDGVFISDGQSVRFLAGKDAEQYTVKDVDAHPAFYGSFTVVPGSHLNPELSRYDSVVVWLSKTGHVAGLPGGSVMHLNPGQLDLPKYQLTSSAIARRDGIKRLVIPVNSIQRNGTGTAIDSEIF